jgi:hypothetical protein
MIYPRTPAVPPGACLRHVESTSHRGSFMSLRFIHSYRHSHHRHHWHQRVSPFQSYICCPPRPPPQLPQYCPGHRQMLPPPTPGPPLHRCQHTQLPPLLIPMIDASEAILSFDVYASKRGEPPESARVLVLLRTRTTFVFALIVGSPSHSPSLPVDTTRRYASDTQPVGRYFKPSPQLPYCRKSKITRRLMYNTRLLVNLLLRRSDTKEPVSLALPSASRVTFNNTGGTIAVELGSGSFGKLLRMPSAPRGEARE